MAGEPHRELLDRATAAVEGIDRTLKRQEKAFERQEKAFARQERALEDLMRQMAEDRVEARTWHERMMRRFERSEKLLVGAISEINVNLQRNTDRLDDMGEAIRANTQAVLSVLDRLGPAPG